MKRILIKVSGEMLGDNGIGFDPSNLTNMAKALHAAHKEGCHLGVVIGAGNLMRGVSAKFLHRAKADCAGMLGTSMNAIALQDILEREFQTECVILGAFAIDGMFEKASPSLIKKSFDQKKIIIFAGGTGSPFFSTDTAGVLKALEMDADEMIKATKVDGIYSADPVKDPTATKYDQISYQEILEQKLNVMDLTAISLAMENHLPLRVTKLTEQNLVDLVRGKFIGTLVS